METEKVKKWLRRGLIASVITTSVILGGKIGSKIQESRTNGSPISVTESYVNRDWIPDKVITSDSGLYQVQYGINEGHGPYRQFVYRTLGQIIQDYRNSFQSAVEGYNALQEEIEELWEQRNRGSISSDEAILRSEQLKLQYFQQQNDIELGVLELEEKYSPSDVNLGNFRK